MPASSRLTPAEHVGFLEPRRRTGARTQERAEPCASTSTHSKSSTQPVTTTRRHQQPPAPGKNVSLTDPAARWTAAPGGPAFFAYSTNYLIDLDAGIIVDVEATPAHRTQEVESTKTMVSRVEQRFGMKPDRLVGDTAYGTASMLGWMVQDKGIAPHIPVWDKSERKDGTLSSSEFTWDEQANEYRCPQGHALLSDRRQFKQPRDRITKAGTILYSASQHDCTGCPMKQECTRTCPTAESCAACTSAQGKLRARSPPLRNTSSRDVIERRSRCGSHISNASSSWIDCA